MNSMLLICFVCLIGIADAWLIKGLSNLPHMHFIGLYEGKRQKFNFFFKVNVHLKGQVCAAWKK